MSMSMGMGMSHWTRDPDHRMRLPLRIPDPVAHVPAGELFPDGIDGARSDGAGMVVLDDDVIAAGRRRAVRALGRANTGALPPLEPTGFLPPGVHVTTRGELTARFAATPERARLFGQLDAATIALRAAGVQHVILGGSLLSSKPVPKDVDLAWVPNSRTTTDAVDAAMSVTRDFVHPNVGTFRADRVVENAPTIAGAAPGETFIELFSHTRSGAARGVALIDITPQLYHVPYALSPARRELVAAAAMRGVRALSSV